jgi:DNA-binding NarL/FixJ family response regulator
MSYQFVKNGSFEKALRGIAQKLTRDENLRLDLLQVMQLNYLEKSVEKPGQTQSWYVKSCEYRARNFLAYGRSLDSLKRSNMQKNTSSTKVCDRFEYGVWEITEDPRDIYGEMVCAELVAKLEEYLDKKHRVVLSLLCKDFGVRDIGRYTGVSHVTVIKRRKHIMKLTRQLLKEKTFRA